MSNSTAFDIYSAEYDRWYDEHPLIFQSELNAFWELLPQVKSALEIGVGSGRFAESLGINFGIDPSNQMLALASRRVKFLTKARAEQLPFLSSSFELVLLSTTLCFLSDAEKAFKEIYRILKPYAWLIIGFIDRESWLGKIYEKKKSQSKFYKYARFYSVPEVVELLKDNNFSEFEFRQVLFQPEDKMTAPDKPRAGWGEGGFVCLRARKK